MSPRPPRKDGRVAVAPILQTSLQTECPRPGHPFLELRMGGAPTLVSVGGATTGVTFMPAGTPTASTARPCPPMQRGAGFADTLLRHIEADEQAFVLRYVQPGLVGLIDGTLSTLAPIFAVALLSSSRTLPCWSGWPPRWEPASAWGCPKRSLMTAARQVGLGPHPRRGHRSDDHRGRCLSRPTVLDLQPGDRAGVRGHRRRHRACCDRPHPQALPRSLASLARSSKSFSAAFSSSASGYGWAASNLHSSNSVGVGSARASAGGSSCRCRHAAGVATRPARVRASIPTRTRNGSHTSSTVPAPRRPRPPAWSARPVRRRRCAQRAEHRAVQPVEAELVDVVDRERGPGDLPGDRRRRP